MSTLKIESKLQFLKKIRELSRETLSCIFLLKQLRGCRGKGLGLLSREGVYSSPIRRGI